MGRPSAYTAEIGNAICERLIEGESLRSICTDEDMPAKSTVLLWVHNEMQPFSDQYVRAREMSGDSDADDVAHYSHQAATGAIKADAANAAINGLKWSAAMRRPKVYGASSKLELSGHLAIGEMSDEDIKAEIAAARAAGILPDG